MIEAISIFRSLAALQLAVMGALSNPDAFGISASVAFFYGSVWPIAAVACVRSGRGTSVIYWPIALVVATAEWPRAAFESVLDEGMAWIKIFATLAPPYAAVLSLIYFVNRRWALYIVIAGKVLAVALSCAIAWTLGFWLLIYLRDRAKLARWQSAENGNIDGATLAARLRELRSGRCRLRLVSSVRSKGGYVEDESGEFALRQLAGELAYRRYTLLKLGLGQMAAELAEPKARAAKVRLRLFRLLPTTLALMLPDYRAECRDEIYMLLERRIGTIARSQPPSEVLQPKSGGTEIGS